MQLRQWTAFTVALGAGLILAGAGVAGSSAHAGAVTSAMTPPEMTYVRTKHMVETASAIATQSAQVVQKLQTLSLDDDDLGGIPVTDYLGKLESDASQLGLTLLTLDIPVTDGYLSSPFGMRNGHFHKGIDFAAPYGSDIRAAQDGRVVFTGWDSGYGQMVTIEHAPGIETRYAHCSAILVQEGQIVHRDQVIAHIGMTGDATGPHVHFELVTDGDIVNPYHYLSGIDAEPRTMAGAIAANADHD